MKILHVISGLDVGGAERLLQHLTAIQAENDEIHVIFLKGSGSILDDFSQEVQVHKIPMSVRGAIFLRRFVNRFKPDVVHSHLVHADIFTWVSLLWSRQRFRKICTIHNIKMGSRIQDALAFYIYQILFNVLHRSLQIVAVSESTKTHVMNAMRMHSKRIHVLGNSIEDKPILDKQVCRERLKVDKNTFVFGFVGRLVPIKQVDIILKACAIIKSKISFICLIGGSGPEEASLKTLAHNLEVADRCRFLGQISDVHGFISACDVLLLSSRSESAGMVIIEAFRAGVPVISNHIEGPAEIIGRIGGGITYQPSSAEQLAKAMLHLVQDAGLREKLGREGRQNFEEYYRIEDYARKLRALYVTF